MPNWRTICILAALLGAFVLALTKSEGWGWFIFIAAILT
ncbi:hypothetical protein NDAWWUGD_CDS0098 [Salmonella phage SeKF_80]